MKVYIYLHWVVYIATQLCTVYNTCTVYFIFSVIFILRVIISSYVYVHTTKFVASLTSYLANYQRLISFVSNT